MEKKPHKIKVKGKEGKADPNSETVAIGDDIEWEPDDKSEVVEITFKDQTPVEWQYKAGDRAGESVTGTVQDVRFDSYKYKVASTFTVSDLDPVSAEPEIIVSGGVLRGVTKRRKSTKRAKAQGTKAGKRTKAAKRAKATKRPKTAKRTKPAKRAKPARRATSTKRAKAKRAKKR